MKKSTLNRIYDAQNALSCLYFNVANAEHAANDAKDAVNKVSRQISAVDRLLNDLFNPLFSEHIENDITDEQGMTRREDAPCISDLIPVTADPSDADIDMDAEDFEAMLDAYETDAMIAQVLQDEYEAEMAEAHHSGRPYECDATYDDYADAEAEYESNWI